MKNTTIVIVILFLINNVKAQELKTFENFIKKANELNISKHRVNELFQNKIDIWNFNKYTELLGDKTLNRLSIYSNSLENNFLVSKHLIIGEVIGIDYNTDSLAAFHSVYTVKVIENINGFVKDTIKILETNGIVGSKMFKSSASYNYYLGSKYLMFIKNAEENFQQTSSFVLDKTKIPNFTDREIYKTSYVVTIPYKINENNTIYIGNKTWLSIKNIKEIIFKLNNLKFK